MHRITNFFNDFEKTFYFEGLKSQKKASFCIVIISFVMGLFWSIVHAFFQEDLDASFGFHLSTLTLASMFFFICMYEAFYTLLLKKSILCKRKISRSIQYLTAFIEASIVSIAFLLLGRELLDPTVLLSSPAIFFYPLFIILSVLKLDYKITLFSTGVTIAGFLFVFHYFTSGIKPIAPLEFYYSTWVANGKAFGILIIGLVIVFVSDAFKKKIKNSLEYLHAKNAIMTLFGQYVSPVVVNALIEQKTDLPPKLQHVCVLFFDIRNFTAYAESHSAQEVIELLNEFFLPLIDIINHHQGFINKFLGDGFMAIFGAPIPDGQDAIHATQAAFSILNKIQEMIDEKKIPEIHVGIGLHAGPAMTGNVGSFERKEYTVIGDTVNVASRVEQLNKEYKSQLIVTESVYRSISNAYTAIDSKRALVKGKQEPLTIFILA